MVDALSLRWTAGRRGFDLVSLMVMSFFLLFGGPASLSSRERDSSDGEVGVATDVEVNRPPCLFSFFVGREKKLLRLNWTLFGFALLSIVDSGFRLRKGGTMLVKKNQETYSQPKISRLWEALYGTSEQKQTRSLQVSQFPRLTTDLGFHHRNRGFALNAFLKNA